MLALLSMFTTIFLAELGDKTQITAMLFATKGGHGPLTVWIVSAIALATATALAIVVGVYGQHHINKLPIKLISGIVFIIMGCYTIFDYWYKK